MLINFLTVRSIPCYRRWHPDQNNGCSRARDRFQLIKDAFEEIQRRQTAESYSKARQSNRTRTSSPKTHTSRYRYQSPSAKQKYGYGSFYNFRHDSRSRDESTSYTSPKGYARARSRERSTTWNQDAYRWVKMRVHARHPMGVGLGVFCAVAVFGAVSLSMTTLWRVKNRGKSFEDLMEKLDAKKSRATQFRDSTN